jgi:hypothetical protein
MTINKTLTRRQAFHPLLMMGSALACPTVAEASETPYHRQSSLVYATESNPLYEIVPGTFDDRYLSFLFTNLNSITYSVKREPQYPNSWFLKYAGKRAYQILVGKKRNLCLVARDGKFTQGTFVSLAEGLKPHSDKRDLWLLCPEDDGYIKIRSFMNPDLVMFMGNDQNADENSPNKHVTLLWTDTQNNTFPVFRWKLRRVS